MPRCGSAEKVITTDSEGFCSSAYCQRESTAPSRVTVMKELTFGVSMAARSHGLSGFCPPIPMAIAGARGGFTITVVLDGIILVSVGMRGRREPIGLVRVASGGSDSAA